MKASHLLLSTLLSLSMTGPFNAISQCQAEILTPFTTETHFTKAAFKAAQDQNAPILIEVFATWCPTCAQQKPIIDKLAQTPEFKKLVLLRVDFDTQKDVVRAFGARMQSTLIVYRGSQLRGETVGDTAPDAIKRLLEKSLS